MNIGFMNEYNIMKVLHNKKISELNDFWKNNILKLFPNALNDDLIRCRLVGGNCKTDFEIIINDSKQNISVKYGENVSLHEEHIDSFIEFLKIIGISESTINTIKLYHFGDGTINGLGKERKNAKELQSIYKNEILAANKELNKKEIIEKIIYRIILKGRNPYHKEIDYLYYGDTKEGVFVSKKELLSLSNIKNMFLECIHFGPFIYQPASRFLYSNSNEKYKRYYSQIKWSSIRKDTNDFC